VRGPDADLALAGRCAASANPAFSRAAAGQGPVVRNHLPDGDTLAYQATGQEQEVKEVLARLDKLDDADPEFEKLLGRFIGAAGAHPAGADRDVAPGCAPP
jgi:hypothetical protein